MEIRLMTTDEYDRMVNFTGGDNALMHWERMGSWVHDVWGIFERPSEEQVHRGYSDAKGWGHQHITARSILTGFRPTVTKIPLDIVPACLPNGQLVVVGTLYMNDTPVPVPQRPTVCGDIIHYIPGATLSMGPPIEDPLYMVTGFKRDDAVYIDRCLLDNISYVDILNNIKES